MYRLDSTDSVNDLELVSCEYKNTKLSSTKAKKFTCSVINSCSRKLYCLTFINRVIFITLRDFVTINDQVSNYKYFAILIPKL